MNSKPATVTNRYFAKLSSNLISMGLNVATLYMLPRGLGAENFGAYDLVTAQFAAIFSMFLLGVPQATYTWYSSQNEAKNLLISSSGLFALTLAISALVLLGALSIQALSLENFFWPGIRLKVIYLALMCSIGFICWQHISGLADARGLTVRLEIGRVFQNLIRAISIFLLFYWGWLSVESYSYLQISVTVVGGYFMMKALTQTTNSKILSIEGLYALKNADHYRGHLWSFTKPMIWYNFIGFLNRTTDRWILQFVSGSIEQAALALSNRFSAISFTFSAALTPILMREFSIAHHQSDHRRLKQLLEKIKPFVCITSFMACGFCLISDHIAKIFGGSELEHSGITLGIMALYPIHQTFGQFGSVIAMSTSRTKEFGLINSIAMAISIPIGWLVLASPEAFIPGLAAGTVGLAIKTISVQAIQTNVVHYFNCKALQAKYFPWVKFQIKTISIFVFLAYFSRYCSNKVLAYILTFFQSNLIDFINIGTFGIIYIFMVLLTWTFIPDLFSSPSLKSILITAKAKFIKA